MPVDLKEILKPIPINGSPVDNLDRPPVRRELRDMRRNHPKEWTLFLLGLESFKNTPEDHPQSWFQIAGIHGRPFTTWPEGNWNKFIKQVDPTGKDRDQWQGFCTHSSILFLPWHRPYLALFETELRRHVQAVAEEYKFDEGRNEYLQAAKTFRLPYWDWALPADKDNGVFPKEALKGATHNIVYPKNRGDKKLKTNPLADYKFGERGTKDLSINIASRVNSTVRRPLRDGATSDEAEVQKKLIEWLEEKPVINKGKNLTERVLLLLQSYETFQPISSNYFSKGQKFSNWGSLEDVHNAVHRLVGGGMGHMGDAAIAAFDPIFWLHHANIDRLFSIWQALWDEGDDKQYVRPAAAKQSERESGGTFSNDWRGLDTVDTELTPFFRSEKGDIWTSRGVRSTTSFGYVYPETQSWLYPEQKDILAQLQSTYPNASLANYIKTDKNKRVAANETFKLRANTIVALETTALSTAALIQTASTDGSDAQHRLELATQQAELPAKLDLADLVSDDKYLEWLVDIRAEKHALGGKFVVHVFLGTPDDENPTLYIADPNHVAIFTTFGTGEDTGCESCKKGQEARLEVTGQIPLTLALVERYLAGRLESITPEHVIPFLQQNLHWRVTDQGGERGSRADVAGLLVSVVSNEVTLPAEALALPQYAPNVTPWPAATTRENGEGRGRGTGYTEASS